MCSMQTASITSPNHVKKLTELLLQKENLLKQKDAEIETLKLRYQQMLEQFRLAQHRKFGKRSEVSPDQLSLFNEVEQVAEEETDNIAVATTQTIQHTHQRSKRQPLLKDLPRETLIHDIREEEKMCSCCGGALHKMGEQRSEQLEFIPAQIKVIEHIRPQYSCRQCEQT